MDVLLKTYLQIILAANWLVWHSSASPNQKQRPLPSLYISFFYAYRASAAEGEIKTLESAGCLDGLDQVA